MLAENIPLGADIGRSIRIIRLIQGVSQEDLAERMSDAVGETVKQAYISKVEQAKVLCSWSKFWIICLGLGVRPSYVFGIAEALVHSHSKEANGVLQETLDRVEEKLDDAELTDPARRRLLRAIRGELENRIAASHTSDKLRAPIGVKSRRVKKRN